MRVIVTGATGFIGRNLIKALNKEGLNVTALLRPESRGAVQNTRKITAGLLDKKELEKKIKDADAVIHLAAKLEGTKGELQQVNVQGTENLLEAAEKNNTKKFIYLSGTMVLGSSKKQLDELSKCEPTGDYAETKLEAENLVLGFKGSIKTTVLRSSMVYGPEEKANRLKIFCMIKNKKFAIFGNGKNHLGLIYVDDLCRAIIHSLKKDLPGLYIVSGGNYTMNGFINIIADELQVKRPMHIPLAIAWPAAIAMGFLGKITGKKMPLFPTRLKNLTSNQELDTTKMQKTGFKPRTSLSQGIRKTAQWYNQEGLL